MAEAKLFLKKAAGTRIALGNPWVFANEADHLQGDPTAGEVVEVCSWNGRFLARGLINPRSQILVRIMTRERQEAVDEGLLDRRIRAAWAYRLRLGYADNCRVVFGESDGLPGLIVDKFQDYLVLQILSLGMDQFLAPIVGVLRALFSPRGIYERNDVPVRELEGLPQRKGFLGEPFGTLIPIEEHGLKFLVDVEGGQKTGYFLDQQANRKQLEHLASGAEVLDAFCYTGSFACHAAHYGAASVQGLDISAGAVGLAAQNAELNGFKDRCRFMEANAFDQLRQWDREGRKFDMVILDPPAFTKSRENISRAVTGYKEINLRGMKLLRPGGFLVTASCTNLVSPSLFLETISAAAADAKKTLRQVVFSGQSSDHPVLWPMESTRYLKFLIAEVN